jgi:arylsulfatase A-like enzyme
MRRILLLLSVLVVSGLCGLSCPSRDVASETSGPPSLVLISVDTLRADHLGCYGYGRKTSPRLDKLARRGVRFERNIAASPWTMPSHATLLTGRPPVVHGAVSAHSVIPQDVVTLSQHLKRQGYGSLGVVSVGFVGAGHGFDRGFDEFIELYDEAELDQEGGGPRAAAVVDTVLERIADRESPDQPLFVFVHFFDPHWPYQAPGEWHGHFEDGYTGPDIVKPLTVIQDGELTPEVHDHLVASYDAEIRYLDQELGRLVDGLADAGLGGALFSVTSDHGEEFLEHNNYDHGHTLHRESLHVPWLISQKGRSWAASTVTALSAGQDVAPTLLGLLDLPPLPGATGHDWAPSLRGEDADVRGPFLCDNARGQHIQLAVYDPAVESKLLLELDRDRLSVYALDADWDERTDLSESRPEEAARLLRALQERAGELLPNGFSLAWQAAPQTGSALALKLAGGLFQVRHGDLDLFAPPSRIGAMHGFVTSLEAAGRLEAKAYPPNSVIEVTARTAQGGSGIPLRCGEDVLSSEGSFDLDIAAHPLCAAPADGPPADGLQLSLSRRWADVAPLVRDERSLEQLRALGYLE